MLQDSKRQNYISQVLYKPIVHSGLRIGIKRTSISGLLNVAQRAEAGCYPKKKVDKKTLQI